MAKRDESHIQKAEGRSSEPQAEKRIEPEGSRRRSEPEASHTPECGRNRRVGNESHFAAVPFRTAIRIRCRSSAAGLRTWVRMVKEVVHCLPNYDTVAVQATGVYCIALEENPDEAQHSSGSGQRSGTPKMCRAARPTCGECQAMAAMKLHTYGRLGFVPARQRDGRRAYHLASARHGMSAKRGVPCSICKSRSDGD